jgi:hypothetical protein
MKQFSAVPCATNEFLNTRQLKESADFSREVQSFEKSINFAFLERRSIVPYPFPFVPTLQIPNIRYFDLYKTGTSDGHMIFIGTLSELRCQEIFKGEFYLSEIGTEEIGALNCRVKFKRFNSLCASLIKLRSMNAFGTVDVRTRPS